MWYRMVYYTYMLQDYLLAGLNKMAKINVHVHRSDRKINLCCRHQYMSAGPNAQLVNDQGFQVRAMLMQININHVRYLSQLCMTRTNLRFAVGAIQEERL